MNLQFDMEANKKQLACLVDDDNVFAFVVEKMLQKNGSPCDLMVFGDGILALDHLKTETNADKIPDIIFLDIRMPVMDGWDFLEEFAQIKDRLPKKITIYMVSSSINPFDKEKALTYTDVSDYISKPITLNQYYSIFKPMNMVQTA